MYSDHDISVILGDFNARVGHNIDYVPDVDDDSIPPRINIDHTNNNPGEIL